MYGAIIGDFAGSIYEYDQLKKVKPIKCKNIIENNSFFSDDTILTVAILDAILNDKNYLKYLRNYIKMYSDYKPSYSPYFSSSFSPSTLKWATSNEIFNSYGNGAMMRISPIGYLFDSEKEVIKNAILATKPTHNTFDALYSAKIIALMIFYFRKGYSKNDVFNKLNLKVEYKPFSKFNYTCKDTLGNILYVIYNSNSFDDAIRNTLLMGGDTDTNCTIVGSVMEAIYGVSDELKESANKKLPNSFVKILECGYKNIK